MQDFDRFLLAVVYDIPVFVFVVDRDDGRVVYANQFLKAMRSSDCVGQFFATLFPGGGAKDHFLSYAQRPVSARSADFLPPQSEYYDDESENWYHVLQRPIHWIDGSRKVVFVLNEINALKHMQKELSEAHATLALKNRELQHAARTDQLTQLANRHQLDAQIEHEMARTQRSSRPFAVLLFDCDHFKSVNDRHGHQAGDRVLIEIASLMRSHVRVTDTVGRWGGEEFLAVLPESDLAGARLVAEKVRQAVAAHSFADVGPQTLSVGLALLGPEETAKSLIARADAALYRAKNRGRNRVEAAE